MRAVLVLNPSAVEFRQLVQVVIVSGLFMACRVLMLLSNPLASSRLDRILRSMDFRFFLSDLDIRFILTSKELP